MVAANNSVVSGKQATERFLACSYIVSGFNQLFAVAVTFSASLPSLSVATFQASQQNDFKGAVLAKAKGATECTLTRWYDGSLQVESAVSFSKADSSANNNANSFTKVLTTDVSSVFPASTYGEVKVANVTQQSSKFKSLFAYFLLQLT